MEGNTSATKRMAAGILTFIIAPATPEALRIRGLWDVLSISRRNCMTVQGSRVKAGQVIGEAAEGKLSMPVHASISGKVVDANEKFVVIEA